MIDSPVLPGRARGAAGAARAGGLRRSPGLLVTHADWDHLLGRFAFPEAAIGCAETTAARLRGRARRRPARAARVRRGALRRAAPAPLSLGAVQALPVPGHCEIGRARARAAPGRRPHRRRHGDPGARGPSVPVLRRLPLAGRDPHALARGLARRPTWRRCERLRAARRAADDGRARPRRAARPATAALAVLREDVAYLDALERDGAAAPLPARRDSGEQRRIHGENVEFVHGRIPR